MKKKKIVSVVCFAMLLAMGCSNSQPTEQADISHSFYWGGTVCTGNYTGEMQGGKPWGKGTFHGYVMRDGQEQDKVSYTGKWKDGRLAGKGVFENLSRGVSYDGKFSNNAKNGEIVVKQDGSNTYEKVTFRKDIPYGISVLYDEKTDGIIGYDRYYKGIRVSEIIADARKFDYAELVYSAEEHYYEKIALDCQVEKKSIREITIDEEKEDSKEAETERIAELQVRDKSGNRYLIVYNIEYPRIAENYMPDVVVGEQIRAYAFTRGLSEIDEGALQEGQYPLLEGVTALREGCKFNFENPAYEYQNFLDFPYEYQGLKAQMSGTIKQMRFGSDGQIFLFVESRTYSENESKNYLCVYEPSDKGDNQIVPIVGDKINVKGKFDTVYLKAEGDKLLMYPRILISNNSLEIKGRTK